MKVSIICSTFRPGGIDILLAGMRDQRFDSFECILVDRRYNIRKDAVAKLAKEYKISNLIHVPEFKTNGKWISFCSAWNTGMALARGEVIILLQDWQYCPPSFAEEHYRAVSGKRRYVLSPYVYTQIPDVYFKQTVNLDRQMQRGDMCVDWDQIIKGEVIDEVSCFRDGLFSPTWFDRLPALRYPDQDPRRAIEGLVPTDNWVHVKNESLLREVAWELNGLDERLERGKGPMDTDWCNRLELAGVELYWAPKGVTLGPNPRFLCRTMPWGDMEERLEGRWSYRDGERYCKIRVDQIKAGGSPAARNSYTLRGLSEHLEGWRRGILDPPPIDVDDMTWWGRELWPETD